MAHFFSGTTNQKSTLVQLDDIYNELTVWYKKPKTTIIENGILFIKNYAINNSINDILIKKRHSDSWLLLIGTPMIDESSEEGKQRLIEDFLKDPKKILRNGRIDGQFCLFAFDEKRGVLVVASDMNSSIPVFYSKTFDSILFASSELALAKLLKAQLDPFGFAQAIHMGTTVGIHTKFKSINKLLPSEIIEYDVAGKLIKDTYWSPEHECLWRSSFDDVLDRWRTLLRDSILMYVNASNSEHVITDFSAGEDARLIMAQCQELNIRYHAWVAGFADDLDVQVAKEASRKLGHYLSLNLLTMIHKEQLLTDAVAISVSSDCYEQFFKSCMQYNILKLKILNGFNHAHFTGIPGGAAFRGEYYLRSLTVLPSKKIHNNFDLFIKYKFLLDSNPGLLKYPYRIFLKKFHDYVGLSLVQVGKFPDGIKVDHLLRSFQTCLWGLMYRIPIYLPYATNKMTRSIYNIPPNFKSGGKLTKACTEILYPELAKIRTQSGVPTIRKTFKRIPLFMPEYSSAFQKFIMRGARRFLNLRQYSSSTQQYLRLDYNVEVFKTLLNHPPYSQWFSSSRNMITGDHYHPEIIDQILSSAKSGQCINLNLLSRVISNELGCRWVYQEL